MAKSNAQKCREYYYRHRQERMERTKEYASSRKEEKKLYDRARYLANKEEHNFSMALWVALNPEQSRKIKRDYYARNKNAVFANCAKYRAGKLNATPRWLTDDHKKCMRDFYAKRPDGYHVDHIVPLRGKNVCGLHVPWNLQYLPALENLRKGRKHG